MLRSTPFFPFYFLPITRDPSHDSFLDPFLVARILGLLIPITYDSFLVACILGLLIPIIYDSFLVACILGLLTMTHY